MKNLVSYEDACKSLDLGHMLVDPLYMGDYTNWTEGYWTQDDSTDGWVFIIVGHQLTSNL